MHGVGKGQQIQNEGPRSRFLKIRSQRSKVFAKVALMQVFFNRSRADKVEVRASSESLGGGKTLSHVTFGRCMIHG